MAAVPRILSLNRFLVLFFAVLAPWPVFTCMADGTPGDEPPVWGRLIRDAPAGWRHLDEMVSSASGTQTWTVADDVRDPSRGNPRDLFRKEVRQFWLKHGYGKLIIDAYDISGKWKYRTVYCTNPDYGFAAKQSSPGGTYVLTVFVRQGDKGFDTFRDRWRLALRATQIAYMAPMSNLPLTQLINEKSFKRLDCHEVQKDGGTVVELDYSIDPTGVAAQWDPSTRQAKLLLDPQADWRYVSGQVTQAKLESHEEVEYKAGHDAPGAATKVTQHIVDIPERGVYSTETFENSFTSFDPPPSSEFYLPSIGMNEIILPSHRRLPILWLVGGNLLLIGLIFAILAAWHRRRASAGPGANTP